jgi:hypothetical protein
LTKFPPLFGLPHARRRGKDIEEEGKNKILPSLINLIDTLSSISSSLEVHSLIHFSICIENIIFLKTNFLYSKFPLSIFTLDFKHTNSTEYQDIIFFVITSAVLKTWTCHIFAFPIPSN